MKRGELEHLVAAAANVVKEDEIAVIGSQAILGSHPDAPAPLLRSIEADVYPLRNPDKADEIDGNLGDGSPFHQAFGYYAHGVGPETAKAPAGWEERLVAVPIPPRVRPSRRATALCLEPHDLVLAKCAAGRERDWEFAREAIRARLVDVEELIGRIGDMPLSEDRQAHIRKMLRALADEDLGD